LLVLFLNEVISNSQQQFSLASTMVNSLSCLPVQQASVLLICNITCFRNRISSCNYPGTRTRFQIWSMSRYNDNDV